MMSEYDVLVVGAGPIGLTVACELRRHGVGCHLIDALEVPPQYAKAVGVQPRTLEVFEDMGFVDRVLEVASEMRGQIVYINGEEVGRVELTLPREVPYTFMSLPQYETERLLREHLARLGGEIERGMKLVSFSQDEDGVTATLRGASGDQEVRARYLVGCDGAHSVVRKQLGLSFAGEAFPEGYMLGDVEVDWSMPTGYAIRAMHRSNGETDDLLVCIPLPGHNRYRISMLVPPELSEEHSGGDGVEHGLATDRPGPKLEHIQAVLDRLSPEPTTASNMRWSSIFRISHRLVDRYSDGRVFVAGDAAHIHPPTGAQGMNTGIQDGYNLAWKLALAVQGKATPVLLDSYNAERLPIGEEVVGRTVREARSQYQEHGEQTMELLREAQLLVGYPDSPLAGESVDGEALGGGPVPGERAPDALLERSGASTRLFELLRGTDPVLLLSTDESAAAETLRDLGGVADAARDSTGGRVTAYAVLPNSVDGEPPGVPVVRDANQEFRSAYGSAATSLYLIRPDGYVGFRAAPATGEPLVSYLQRIY